MNFNKEIAKELEVVNLGGKILEIPEKDKGKPADYMKLEKSISVRCYENEVMIQESSKAKCLPLG